MLLSLTSRIKVRFVVLAYERSRVYRNDSRCLEMGEIPWERGLELEKVLSLMLAGQFFVFGRCFLSG